MIRVGTTSTVYAISRTVQTGYPVESRPNTFYATNAAWQDHSVKLHDPCRYNKYCICTQSYCPDWIPSGESTRRTVQTGYPVESQPNMFFATNVACQDYSDTFPSLASHPLLSLTHPPSFILYFSPLFQPLSPPFFLKINCFITVSKIYVFPC